MDFYSEFDEIPPSNTFEFDFSFARSARKPIVLLLFTSRLPFRTITSKMCEMAEHDNNTNREALSLTRTDIETIVRPRNLDNFIEL